MQEDKVDYSRYYIKNKHTYNEVSDDKGHQVEYIQSTKSKDKTKVKKDKKHGKRIVFAVTIILLILVSVVLISDTLRGGYLMTSIEAIIKGEGKVEKVYYGVEMRTFEDIESARVYANGIRRKQGAGYVISDDGYRVLVNLYSKQSDAEEVAKKLKLDGENARVYRIEIHKIDYSNIPSSSRNVVKDVLTIHDAMIRGLYDIGMQLASKEIDENSAKMKISGLKSEMHNIISEFEANIDGDENNANLVKIKAELVSIEAMLDNLSKDVIKRPNLLSDIRYTTCLIANAYRELTRELA